MNAETIQTAYAALGGFTPLKTDCGTLCAGACCQPDEDGQGGVYLFPGEESLLDAPTWGRVKSDAFAPMLICEGPCTRQERPLACRIFPLTPVKNEEGRWTVRMDVRARAMCPLARSGLKGLDPDFVRAVRRAIRVIAQEPDGEAFLEKWAALEEEYRFTL